MLTCEDLEGGCCDGCHEDVDDEAAELTEIHRDGQVVARVCCAKIDAAHQQLGIDKPKLELMTNFR